MPRQQSEKKLHLKEKVLTAEGWRKKMAKEYPEKYDKSPKLSVKKKPAAKKKSK